MSIVLTDISALQLWRSPEFARLARVRAPKRVASSQWSADADAATEAMRGLGCSPPLHLLVADSARRRTSMHVVSHLCPEALAREPLYEVEPGILVVAPALCLLQLCRNRNLVAVAKVAYEFCGGFALDDASDRGFYDRPSLTSTKRLLRFLARLPSRVSGAAKLGKILPWVCDGAASPMEAIAALHLVLPSSRGGYGLPRPELNRAVHVPSRLYDAIGKRVLYCDLYWPRFRLAVEYDSDRYHANEPRIAEDARRRAALELMGIEVLILTRKQAMDVDALDAVAKLIAGSMGRRALPQARDFRAKQLRLRAELLNFEKEL